MWESSLIRKLRLISKFIMLRKQTITTHILLNISSSKGNKTTKFGQLIKYNVSNISLYQLCRK